MTNLYYLFRGKKKNKLRDRIDFNYFELDQLLMGTLLFIIMVYLTPTVLAFYISYTCLRLCLIYSEISLESIITLINHFPLFALLLRVKDPKRLPGGVSFDIGHDNNGTFLLLKNNPLKIGMLFKSFNIVLQQVMNNYCSIHTILNIINGNPDWIKYKHLSTLYPDTQFVDPVEQYRLDKVAGLKRRGKGAPKKMKKADVAAKKGKGKK